MFVVVFIINFVGIFIFSLRVLPAGVNEQVSAMKEQANLTVSEIISDLQISDNFYESVDEDRISKSMLIYIEDLDGNIVYSYPDSTAVERINRDENLYITASEKFLSTNSNGQQIYFIKAALSMQNSFTFEDIPAFMSLYLGRILTFEAILFTIAMVIIIISVRKMILTPLVSLAKSIRGYNKNAFVEEENTEKDEFKSLAKDFETLTAQLTEEQRKQTRIIASVSHDIKTPLTSIMGYAEQLRKDDISPERKNRYVNTVYEKSLAIKKLIEGLDDYITYNDKADTTEKSVVSVRQLLTAVDSYFRDDLERVNCDFVINDNTGDSLITINKADMLRLFGNIINNSVKHRSSEILKILIEAEASNSEIKFKISDNGEGVLPNQYVKIFEPLYTTDESRSKSVSGLGLSICKDIIESHFGKIHAQKSIYDTGLSIVFTLPRANANKK